MKILFVSCCCGQKKNQELFEKRNKKIIVPSQKFFYLLLTGMANNSDVDITCISSLPVSYSTCSQRKWQYDEEIVSENLRFLYLPFKNGKVSRFSSVMKNCYKYVNEWCKKNKNEECCIVTDSLIWTSAWPALAVAKKHKIKTCTFITDLPQYANIKSKRNIFKKIISSFISSLSNKKIKQYDGYIFISRYMASIIKKNNLKYIVIESSVDKQLTLERNVPPKNDPHNKIIFMYAGGVYRKYGIENFAKAISQLDINAEFWIYGNGDFADFLEENPNYYKNTIYKGCVSCDDIVKIERQADILINPRPINEEYNKYSFPSKTTEYMSTGVPVLSTRLPGIPEEYENYLLWFEGDDEQSLINSINNIMKFTKFELNEFGKKAFEFCMTNKTNEIQGKKICDFIKRL